jgi:hypothetical protein
LQLVILKGNCWKYDTEETTISSPDGLKVYHAPGLTTKAQFQHVFAAQGFPVSVEHAGKNNFVGTFIWYFEVTQTSARGVDGSVIFVNYNKKTK